MQKIDPGMRGTSSDSYLPHNNTCSFQSGWWNPGIHCTLSLEHAFSHRIHVSEYNCYPHIKHQTLDDFLCHYPSLHRVIFYTYLAMPKIRDSASKADIFEVTMTQTWQGKRITQVSVKDSPSPLTPSHNASPSKKRAWSPGALEPNDDNFTRESTPKHSRAFGKVWLMFDIMS
jgi:hypothetical protein